VELGRKCLNYHFDLTLGVVDDLTEKSLILATGYNAIRILTICEGVAILANNSSLGSRRDQ
jgi:hypothetical protein